MEYHAVWDCDSRDKRNKGMKPSQYCKAIILQLKIKFFKNLKKKKRNKGRPFASWDVKTKVERADLTEMMK